MENKNRISDIADINYITPENAEFILTENNFVLAKLEGFDGFKRVHLNRAFPHDLEDEFISVADTEQNEVGIIRRIGDFDSTTAEILKKELERKYFAAKIEKIISHEERFGNSSWLVKTSQGERVINLKDTFKSIIRIGEDRIVIVDEDANRYEIESLSALDRNSFRKIELYL